MGKTIAAAPTTKSATKVATKPIAKPIAMPVAKVVAKVVVTNPATKSVDKKTAKANMKGDLDALFNTKSKSLKKVKKEEPIAKVAPKKPVEAKAKPARYTDDGLRIYSKEELNMGKGGDTADCPFDCDCCF